MSFSSKEIAEKLTLAGLEVDAIETVEPSFEGVIVAKVLEVSKHPNADKLCIAKIFDGKDEKTVVCGASNCRKDLTVAFAPIDSILTDSESKKHKIQKGTLRGVESYGMLLSAEELQLEDKSDGIIELSEDLKPGTAIAPFFQDEILEISFTPNLGHCMSVLGVSRELSALIKKPFEIPSVIFSESKTHTIEKKIKVKVENKNDCPRYCARLIENVKIGPSPFWLRQRLHHCGIKSINNVVDITNYVLLEMGQPLHAFDYDSISSKIIEIKMMQPKGVFETLDGEKRNIKEEMLFICDKDNPIALAGIMGGANSQISDKTTNILLEGAYFDAKTIRKASRALSLFTDASKHFERGVDPRGVDKALDRAAALIAFYSAGEVAKSMIDQKASSFERKKLDCRLSFLNKLLGTKFTIKKVLETFESLDFSPKKKDENTIEVLVPTYRHDISLEEDLIEEVIRIIGFDALPKNNTKYSFAPLSNSPLYTLEKRVISILLNEGLQEIITSDLVNEEISKLCENREQLISPLNYVSKEHSVLRKALIGNHLQVIKRNQDHQANDFQAFEIGKVYRKNEEGEFLEESEIGIVLTGRVNPYHYEEKDNFLDFYHLKGIVENLLEALKITDIIFERSTYSVLHPNIQAHLTYKNKPIGVCAEIHPSYLRKLNIKQPVFFASLDLANLLVLEAKTSSIKPLSPYPSSERDWTLTALEDLEIGHMIRFIKSIPSRLLKHVYLLDLFRSEKIGADRKNVTLRFVYRNDKKTISFESTEVEHARIVSEVQEKMKNLLIQPT